jgi:hypothetical protein
MSCCKLCSHSAPCEPHVDQDDGCACTGSSNGLTMPNMLLSLSHIHVNPNNSEGGEVNADEQAPEDESEHLGAAFEGQLHCVGDCVAAGNITAPPISDRCLRLSAAVSPRRSPLVGRHGVIDCRGETTEKSFINEISIFSAPAALRQRTVAVTTTKARLRQVIHALPVPDLASRSQVRPGTGPGPARAPEPLLQPPTDPKLRVSSQNVCRGHEKSALHRPIGYISN